MGERSLVSWERLIQDLGETHTLPKSCPKWASQIMGLWGSKNCQCRWEAGTVSPQGAQGADTRHQGRELKYRVPRAGMRGWGREGLAPQGVGGGQASSPAPSLQAQPCLPTQREQERLAGLLGLWAAPGSALELSALSFLPW